MNCITNIIKAYFTNANEASDFQTAYENAGLPQNGQTVTFERCNNYEINIRGKEFK